MWKNGAFRGGFVSTYEVRGEKVYTSYPGFLVRNRPQNRLCFHANVDFRTCAHVLEMAWPAFESLHNHLVHSEVNVTALCS
jgi:hypothetical protein